MTDWPEPIDPPLDADPTEDDQPPAITAVLRGAGAYPDEVPLPPPPVTPPPLRSEVLTPSLAVTPEGEVIAFPPVDEESLGPVWLDQLSLLQSILLYFGAYGPWALAFAMLLPYLNSSFEWPFWLLLGAGWTPCFLAVASALYLQAIAGFGHPDRSTTALTLCGVLGAALFGATLFVMRDPAH
ncbi:MAG: hypothetical protein ABI743_14720, partial [bacterium]